MIIKNAFVHMISLLLAILVGSVKVQVTGMQALGLALIALGVSLMVILIYAAHNDAAVRAAADDAEFISENLHKVNFRHWAEMASWVRQVSKGLRTDDQRKRRTAEIEIMPYYDDLKRRSQEMKAVAYAT